MLWVCTVVSFRSTIQLVSVSWATGSRARRVRVRGGHSSQPPPHLCIRKALEEEFAKSICGLGFFFTCPLTILLTILSAYGSGGQGGWHCHLKGNIHLDSYLKAGTKVYFLIASSKN